MYSFTTHIKPPYTLHLVYTKCNRHCSKMDRAVKSPCKILSRCPMFALVSKQEWKAHQRLTFLLVTKACTYKFYTCRQCMHTDTVLYCNVMYAKNC